MTKICSHIQFYSNQSTHLGYKALHIQHTLTKNRQQSKNHFEVLKTDISGKNSTSTDTIGVENYVY